MKILVPVDGSANALRAVDYVVRNIAELKEVPQLRLLNVQRNVAQGNVKLFIDKETINDYCREQGMAALQSARAAFDAAGLSYQYRISIGNTAEAIAQYALDQQADQIVMGRKGLGGLQSLLLGTVVKKVLQLADCPVVLIK
ncbi:MAG: universal stress protein [Gallionella sp.]|nr:universal stress protein [Gallionella sp.]